ncbi:unnamed protein product [Notodromas monacha]|uniref:Uncharacterized protein n=1 Tax=Notodromas monacha TaxID=399045 RepID=A0A7R9BYD4_9CRUS|nr:unnamed protein product [Notodromas monacha]CAG0922936.1 unnamed protein product [Notodromas monacha]
METQSMQSLREGPGPFSQIASSGKNEQTVYPADDGWVIRVYHDYEANDATFQSVMCNASCQFGNIDFCNVKHLQAPLDAYASPSKLNSIAADPVMNRYPGGNPVETAREVEYEWYGRNKNFFHIPSRSLCLGKL